MAKFVIAGQADCPYYAKVELLADTLATSFDSFRVHKIVKTAEEWEGWVKEECAKRKFSYSKSPVVWRELVDRGGKGVLIGGANEFQEYACSYYGIKSSLMTSDVQKISEENLATKHAVDQELLAYKSQSNPMKICITNASSPVTYHLLNGIASGEVFGTDNELIVNLLGSSEELQALEGIKMEAFDLACNELRGINVLANASEALNECEAVIMLDQLERQEEESEESWIKRNCTMFVDRIKVIDTCCKKNVRVLVASNGPVNSALYMMQQQVMNINKKNIIVMPRLIENQAKALLAQKVKVKTSDIVDIIVWGDNEHYFCDVSHARVHNHDGAIWGPSFYSRLITLLVHEEQWLAKDFHEQLKLRYSVEKEKMNHVPAFAHAAAVMSLMKHWWFGSPNDQLITLGVASEGWYGVPEGMVFNFPARLLPAGNWVVAEDYQVSEDIQSQIKSSVDYLMEQRYLLFPELRPPPPEPEKTEVLTDSPHPPTMTPIREETDQELKPSDSDSGDATGPATESDEQRATSSGKETLERIKEESPINEHAPEDTTEQVPAEEEQVPATDEQAPATEEQEPAAEP